MTAVLWKAAALVLMALLVVTGVGGGVEWWLAARARDMAVASLAQATSANKQLTAGLATQKDSITQLQAAVDAQNKANNALAAQKQAADAKGEAAAALAKVAGVKLDAALARMAQFKPTASSTCDDAMPYVDDLLKGIQ